MIPVLLQPEPLNFDPDVRQRGQAWLAERNIALNSAPPEGTTLPSYWQKFNQQLWDSYSGTCCYLAIFFEFVTGASSTDHFVAKSKNAGEAYEWNNYRLSCLGANRNKNRFDDVLDPIGLRQDTFVLNLFTGAMRPNQSLTESEAEAVKRTIRRLRLNSEEHKRMRAKHFTQYLRHKDAQTLKELNPFVWYEAYRQELL